MQYICACIRLLGTSILSRQCEYEFLDIVSAGQSVLPLRNRVFVPSFFWYLVTLKQKKTSRHLCFNLKNCLRPREQVIFSTNVEKHFEISNLYLSLNHNLVKVTLFSCDYLVKFETIKYILIFFNCIFT